jgi:DnaK suppressor protein
MPLVSTPPYKRILEDQLADGLAVTATSIRRALALIDEGRFGHCESCGQPVGEARLQAVPWALLCVRCQSADERGHGPAWRRP